MNDEQKFIINTQGGPVITGGNFIGTEFVANKYVVNEAQRRGGDFHIPVDAPPEKDYNTSSSVPFSALVTNPSRTDEILKKLHELVERPGKPKTIIMPIRAAMDAGAISRPTWEQFCAEFGKDRVRSKSSLTDYTNENYIYVGNDFESMKETFRLLMQ